MSRHMWVCESCDHAHPHQDDVWECPGCGMETCEGCFSVYAHCKRCAVGKSAEELRLHANAVSMYAFEEEPPIDEQDRANFEDGLP